MARSGMGFPARWVTKFEIDENPRRQVLGVRRCIPRSDANSKLEEVRAARCALRRVLLAPPDRPSPWCRRGCCGGQGDLLLAINGKTMISYRDVELAVQNSEADSVTVTILRREEEVDVDVKLATLDSMGTIRVVVRTCMAARPSCVVRRTSHHSFVPLDSRGLAFYCTPLLGLFRRWASSQKPSPRACIAHDGPTGLRRTNMASALRYGVGACACVCVRVCAGITRMCSVVAQLWVTEVNNKPTPDLDAFNEATRGIQHMDNVRLKTVDLQGRHAVRTLKTDLVYFFGYELTWDAATGQWHQHEPTVNGRGVVTGEKVPTLPSVDA